MSFIDKLLEELNNELLPTENGALGYETSGSALVDLNFATSSLRMATESEILEKFIKAYAEDQELAVKWLFFARDVRGGMGERRLFRVVASALANINPSKFIRLMSFIPEYGRWDDLIYLLDDECTDAIEEEVFELIRAQLAADLKNMADGEPVSLLAKWLPSEKASSKKTRHMAHVMMRGLGLTNRQYRKILSALRRHIDVVEVKICDGRWDEIEYSAVPSKANLKYQYAFVRHDGSRYNEFVQAALNGEQKMNSGTLYPYEIVNAYWENIDYWSRTVEYNEPLEALWKNLPRESIGGKALVVSDGSGSMYSNFSGMPAMPAYIAQSLAIYFSEGCVGEFKDKFITFSHSPRLVDLGKADSLADKLEIIRSYDEVANTNIEAVFALILNTALHADMKQEDVPERVIIISDMEFDMATTGNTDRTLFQGIESTFAAAGYKMPKLVFWNVASRSGSIPVREAENGVALVSGFSPQIVDMITSDKLDPREILVERLMSERYKDIKWG